jgi:hypothetical protein
MLLPLVALVRSDVIHPKLDLVGFIVSKGQIREEVFDYAGPIRVFIVILTIENRQHFSFR